MSIRGLQIRLSQVGVIRLGERRTSAKGKLYPAKLETFRITSPSKDLIEEVAKRYGGEVRPWPDGPTGPEWQVTTTVNELPVFVLPQRIDPNLELWGKGHRQRLCDGVTERIRGVSCLCEQAARERYARAKRPWPDDDRFERTKDDCKPTTRLAVMLDDVSDGQWKVEAHGWNAAAELPAKATVYLALARKPVPAKLRLKVRKDAVLRVQPDGSEKVESREYVVPELDFGNLFSARQALTGGVDAAVRAALERQGAAALESAQRLAIDASPQWLALIQNAPDQAALDDLKGRMQAAGVRDASLVEAWVARSKALAETPQPAVNPPAPVDVSEPVDAEVEPDPAATWMAILGEAGGRGWDELRVRQVFAGWAGGQDVDDADGWRLDAFLTALRAGRVGS